MDRSLFASCIGSATQIMGTTAGLINMHHSHAKRVVIEAAVELYEAAMQVISEKEAEEKARGKFDFARVVAEQEAVDQAEAKLAASEGAQAAVSGLPGVKERERDV